MMRRYHRWLSVLFGLFILWIAVTGVLTQFARLTAGDDGPPAAAPAVAADARHSATATHRPAAAEASPAAPGGPPQSAARKFIHFITDLHSGAQFGPVGQWISLLSGLALVFFAVSGLTMYIQLFRGRLVKVRGGGTVRGGKWFWR